MKAKGRKPAPTAINRFLPALSFNKKGGNGKSTLNPQAIANNKR